MCWTSVTAIRHTYADAGHRDRGPAAPTAASWPTPDGRDWTPSCGNPDTLKQMVDGRIDPSVAPSGSGCAECLAAGGWWLH